jgi:methionyl-tRNA synthetase
VEERQPWTQAKDPAAAGELDQTLASLARALAVLCALFQPVAPAKMADLAGRLGLGGVPTLAASRTVALGGRRVTKGAPLFPRVEIGTA